jgi:phosphoesterase RecJ-like protein
MKNDLLNLIKDAQRIFITSHVSPDPDAICSVLLLANTLRENMPEKEVLICLEEQPAKDVSFLSGHEQIKFESLSALIESFNPDLFIMLDANNFERISRAEGQKIKNYVSQNSIKTVIIDHHQAAGKDDVDLYINDDCPATVQNVYEICFSRLNLKKPKGYGDTTMLGILDDTGRFLYENPKHEQTLELVNSLIDEGVSIEALWNHLNRYTEDQLEVISELIKNIVVDSGFTYSFLDDDFCSHWLESKGEPAKLKGAVDWFKDNFLRSVGDNTWGFVVYKDPSETEGEYSVSFRAINGTKDVSELARKLSGGGHKAAAGGHVNASSIRGAIASVKAMISDTSI